MRANNGRATSEPAHMKSAQTSGRSIPMGVAVALAAASLVGAGAAAYDHLGESPQVASEYHNVGRGAVDREFIRISS